MQVLLEMCLDLDLPGLPPGRQLLYFGPGFLGESVSAVTVTQELRTGGLGPQVTLSPPPSGRAGSTGPLAFLSCPCGSRQAARCPLPFQSWLQDRPGRGQPTHALPGRQARSARLSWLWRQLAPAVLEGSGASVTLKPCTPTPSMAGRGVCPVCARVSTGALPTECGADTAVPSCPV